MLALWLKVVGIGCCVLWYHTQANINKVESIQRRAARFVTNNYEPRASVTRPQLAHLTTQTPIPEMYN
jgi:hypothetical protein